MRILLYTGGQKLVETSGVGKAISHQERALMLCGADITKNPKGAYDVLHVNTVFPDALWMAKRAKRQGKTVVYHAHSTMEDFRNSFIGSNLLAPLFNKWLCLCYNTADLVLTPTPYSRELLEGYGLKVPVKAISNGVDTEFFVKKPEQRQRFREAYGIRDEDPVVLSVGLPIERKGILDFIALAEQLPKVQFFWFGYASPGLLPKRVKRAMKKPLPNLHFPGFVNKEQLRDAYGGSDLFLFLTREETEGIVLLEALSMQFPVVVRDIPVFRDAFAVGVNLYKRKSPEEFREITEKILKHETADLTAQGYLAARERDIRCIGGQLLQAYKEASFSSDSFFRKLSTARNAKEPIQPANKKPNIKRTLPI